MSKRVEHTPSSSQGFHQIATPSQYGSPTPLNVLANRPKLNVGEFNPEYKREAET